eukprot:TRINITY_DN3301_c0_g1_i3.p1 TRINITY_DN3301_c0_g1~~TRINITY_DN3301_c0_g1_i3.p1  ORF type:complete len:495 (-),score=25.88 TRINITY_DN3301_c0_g1_i3:17-1501(-)
MLLPQLTFHLTTLLFCWFALITLMSQENSKHDRYVLALFVGSSVSLGLAAWYAGRRKWLQMKPQRNFTKILADNTDAPFPHVLPEQSVDRVELEQNAQNQPNSMKNGLLKHPYGPNVWRLMDDKCIPKQLNRDPVLPQDISQCRCILVNTLQQLSQMCAELSVVDRIGIDVEHHHIHSYWGFTCLLQLSTGETDYVVDCIALHDHMGLLSDIFRNESIMKILHGGDNDVMWLQKDFGLYLVNVFDTTRAAAVIGRIKQINLANLLKHYCNVETDKSYQLADWRIRPLTEAMMTYARIDAHYLCFLADQLACELRQMDEKLNNIQNGMMSDNSLLYQAIKRSQQVSLNMFEKITHEASAIDSVKAIARVFESRDRKRNILSKKGSKSIKIAITKDSTITSSCSEEEPTGCSSEVTSQSRQDLTFQSTQLQAEYIEQELDHHFPWSRRGGEAFLDCLYALCVWRDKVARNKDENIQYWRDGQYAPIFHVSISPILK